MAHFYGTLQGQRGQATRCGSKAGGLTTVAASWQGAVEVTLYLDEETGSDMARVEFRQWHGQGTSGLIYDGPISGAGRVLTLNGQRVATGEDGVIAAREAV